MKKLLSVLLLTTLFLSSTTRATISEPTQPYGISNTKYVYDQGQLLLAEAIPAWGEITGTLANQTDLQAALDLKAEAADLADHEADVANPHSVTKTQVGLGNADNTSDANKPISTATQTALDLKLSRIAASSSQLLVVSKAGSDVVCPASPCGDGSLDRPYLTWKAAQAAVSDNATGKRYTMLVLPGVYTEAVDLVLKPFINVVGLDKDNTHVKRSDSSAITLDGTGVSARFSIRDVRFLNGLTVDRTAAANGLNLEMIGVWVDGAFTWNGIGPGKDLGDIDSCYFSSTFTMNATAVTLRNNIVFGLTTLGTTGGTNLLSGQNAYSSALGGYYYQVALNADNAHNAIFEFYNSKVDASLALTGTGSGVIVLNIDGDSQPQVAANTTSAGSVTINKTTRAHSMGYVPGDGADWADADPVTVQEALDRMADLLRTLNGGTAIP